MSPPPAGALELPSIGDAPTQAESRLAAFNDIVNICCVLQGDWPPEAHPWKHDSVPDLGLHYVERLYEMVSKHAPRNQPWRFICFTDRRAYLIPAPSRPLPRGLYGWFNKLWLFSPEAFPVGARVLYLDLDTCIVGNLAGLASVGLQRPVFLRGVRPSVHASSGIFSFRAGPQLHPIWREFEAQSQYPPPYKTPRPITPHLGKVTTDELWIRHFVTDWAAWQDLLPGACLSYKSEARGKDFTGNETAIYFHGLPRPHTVKEPWNPIPNGL